MATPIEIVKNYYRYDDKKNKVIDAYDSFELDLNSGEALFNIDETDDISLVFNFSPMEYEIEIEDASTGDLNEVIPGKEFDFNYWSEQNSFFPGYFDLYVTDKNNNRRNRYYFAVHPKHTNISNILYLRSYVNDYYDGLSLDLEKKRRMKVVFDENSQSSSDFSSYNYLLTIFPTIINYMNIYTKRRPEQLIKKETVSPKFTKISAKSIRWLSQKGYKKNRDLNRPEVILGDRTSFTVNNEQNRIFRSYVIFWDNELKSIINNLSDYEKRISDNIVSLQEQLTSDKNDYNVVSKIKTISSKAKKQLAGKIKDNEEKIKSSELMLEEYSRRIKNVLHYKTFTENIRYNSWIKLIDSEENYDYKKLTNKELLLIKEYKDRYIGIKRRVSYGKVDKIDYFSEKGSPKLFETYLYVLIINILKNHGFDIDEDLLPIGDLMYTLSSQSKVILSNTEGESCEIMYDKPLSNAQEEFAESDFCSINSTHNRPDFIIAFKDSEGAITKTIVVDAKWRKLDNIYNEHGDTEVMINLKDYLNLGYYDVESNDINRGIVTRVLAVYPDDDEQIQNTLGNLISYCGIKICKEIETTKNYAYLDSVLFSKS